MVQSLALFLALLISVPIGLGVAIFLSEDYLSTKIQRLIVFLVELLAAVPSVVYGLWGIFVFNSFSKKFYPPSEGQECFLLP